MIAENYDFLNPKSKNVALGFFGLNFNNEENQFLYAYILTVICVDIRKNWMILFRYLSFIDILLTPIVASKMVSILIVRHTVVSYIPATCKMLVTNSI